MKKHKTIAAITMTGALAGGALFGTVLGNPLASGAQDADTEATAPGPDVERGHRGPHGRGPGLDAAAEALGIEADELRTELRDGQTLAQVAEARGVDTQTVIDALVADATDHIDQKVADGDLTQEEADARLAEVTERITTMVNEGRPAGEGPGGRGGPHGPHGRGPGLDAAAEALGIEADELRTQLRDGQTLAQVAEARGVDTQTVIDALVADATDHIDQKVADGDLTQEEADARLAEVTERITTMVNEGRPERPADAPEAPEGD